MANICIAVNRRYIHLAKHPSNLNTLSFDSMSHFSFNLLKNEAFYSTLQLERCLILGNWKSPSIIKRFLFQWPTDSDRLHKGMTLHICFVRNNEVAGRSGGFHIAIIAAACRSIYVVFAQKRVMSSSLMLIACSVYARTLQRHYMFIYFNLNIMRISWSVPFTLTTCRFSIAGMIT